jgi:hypothetical protein
MVVMEPNGQDVGWLQCVKFNVCTLVALGGVVLRATSWDVLSYVASDEPLQVAQFPPLPANMIGNIESEIMGVDCCMQSMHMQ